MLANKLYKTMHTMLLLTLLCMQPWFGSSLGNLSRRDICQKLMIGCVAHCPSSAMARNLPKETDINLSQTGTLATLMPIVEMQSSLRRAVASLSQQHADLSPELIHGAELAIVGIPILEQDFKRIFDQYSDPVSYKQKFLDQNAFLVYYSKGFDGPNRPPIESDLPEKQTLQYGARNEAWVAWEGFVAELRFAKNSPQESSLQELLALLKLTVAAVDSYLSLAPPSEVMKANGRIQ